MMKSGKFSIAVLCMGLAGCSLPFFSQPQKDTASLEKEESVFAEFADEMQQKAVAQESVTEESNSKVKSPLSDRELAAVEVQKEKDLARFESQEAESEKVVADVAEENPAFTKLVKTIQANLFDEEEVDEADLLEEEIDPTDVENPGVLELDETFVKQVEFIEPDIIPSEDTVGEEIILDEEEVIIESLEESDDSKEEVTSEISEDISPLEETPIEIPAVEIPEEIIPAGALPSTGTPSPLATLWGWVKSWF